jgi:hypothetical protein
LISNEEVFNGGNGSVQFLILDCTHEFAYFDGFPGSPVVNLTIPGSDGYAKKSFQYFRIVAYSVANTPKSTRTQVAGFSALKLGDEQAEMCNCLRFLAV